MASTTRLRDFLDVCQSGPSRVDTWFDDVAVTIARLVGNTVGASISVSSCTTHRGVMVALAGDPAAHDLPFDQIPPEVMRKLFRPLRVGRFARLIGVGSLKDIGWGRAHLPDAIVDGVRIAIDLEGIRLAAVTPLSAAEAERLEDKTLLRVHRHLAGGFARRRRTDWATKANAIIDGAGRVLLAAPDSHSVTARATEIARELEKDFSLDRGIDRDAEDLWTELWNAGWTVEAVADTDGKRLIVLRRRDQPGTPLTRHERAVLQGRAQGHGLKRIASDLGVSSSTTRTHLQRALNKLGVEGATPLLQILGAHGGML